MISISLDAMSGDRGPEVVLKAARLALARHDDLHFVLVGDKSQLQKLAASSGLDSSRITLQHASEVVTMDDAPAHAIRRKKDSSMRVALNLLSDASVQACVSAGNTGALMATAKFVLKTVPGIDRPAIVSEVPTRTGSVLLLDLGANADCSPTMLHQFALMGSVLSHDMTGTARPRVALLNIGEEQTKGDTAIREAAALVQSDSRLNYVGFIEGDRIFGDSADVVVTDGFTGNVALKTMEGTAALVGGYVRAEFNRSVMSRILAFIASPVLKRLKARLDPRHYNGATFIGLRGTVVKSHGGADEIAFLHAIETAVVETRAGVINHIGQQLEET